MRTLQIVLFALLLAGGLMPAASASATERTPYICWEQPNGTTACANLPHDYHLQGIKRPFCDREHACNHSTLDFKLTRETIHDLACYTHTSTMRPFHLATLYDGHWHTHHHHGYHHGHHGHHHGHHHHLQHHWVHGEHQCHVEG